jgi:hypothetical protein
VTAPDFISGYADYADVLEAPRSLHELVAIQLVASVLNRNGVSIPLGGVRYSLDLWALLLSGSGAGRSTTVGLATPILKGAGMQGLESSAVWGSAPALYQHFAENPSGLLIWGEMAERLKLLNEPRFATVKPWLTDRYDNFTTPPPFRYRRTGKKNDTPTIDFREPPRINILATSSEDWFFRNLAETDSAGGFLARWVILRATGNSRVIPVPQVPDASLVPPLVERLKQIDGLNGDADLSAILPAYDDWYSRTNHRFESQPNPAFAKVYFNRHRGHVLKLAVIFEASQSGTLRVSLQAWERAVEFARRVEDTIFDLLPTGMSAIGFTLMRIEERIKAAGPTGLAQNELTRAFQHMEFYERQKAIDTLLKSGAIFSRSLHTAGRAKTVYVHANFQPAPNPAAAGPDVTEGVRQ